jgi:hypothetical protein
VNRPTSAGIAITAERAIELSVRLGVPVTIDETGWLSHGVALCYQRGPHGTIQPRGVLVGASCLVQDVLAHARIVAHSQDYNDALEDVRALRDGLRAMSAGLQPGAQAYALHQELLEFDETVAKRQAARMGNGLVSPAILESEIAYFRRWYADGVAIVRAAKRDLET